MGTTTFSGPIKAGTIREGATANTGQVLMAQTDFFDYTDTSDKTLGIIIPANSQIVNIAVSTEAAFDAGTTNHCDVGIVGNSDLYIDNLSIGNTGNKGGGAHDLVANWLDVGTSDVTLAAKYIQSGSAATAGVARITVMYQQNNNLA